MMAENAPSELRVFLKEQSILSSGCPVSFEGEMVMVKGQRGWRERYP